MKHNYIHFLGAAETVTGSKFLLNISGYRILIDCGLFQGIKKLRNLNWVFPPVNPQDIQAMIVTHGHLDHVGFIPRMVKAGYNKKIYLTEPTFEIAKIILRDSAKIQMEEAETINRLGYSKHNPAKPLYDLDDVEQCLPHFHPIPLDKWVVLNKALRFRLRYVGHILGAAYIEIEANGQSIIFSGDVGRTNDSLMYHPIKPKQAEYLILESTYGNRVHKKREEVQKEMLHEINATIEKGGSVIIPSFAVERTQEIMYLLWKARNDKTLRPVPMYVDSPMGKNVMDVFFQYPDWHKIEIHTCRKICDAFYITADFNDTQNLLHDDTPKIIIAGSGMITGGRVLFYLQKYIEREETTVLLVGYQADGTRGRRLLNGDKEIKIFGRYYPVKARIVNLEGLSAHADYTELLLWLSELEKPPRQIFLVHGEISQADALRVKLEERFPETTVIIPSLFETCYLS